MKIDVFNVLGKSVSSIEISDSIFNIEPHKQSMFDLLMSERARSRTGNHNTKNRSEVSGGGKKPWRQKGTGRARQGSIRSPQWRGGGIVFGPTSKKNYELKVNKKVVKLAKKSGWSIKANANEIFILDDIEFNTPSTSDFKQMLKNFNLETSKVIILLSGDSSDYNVYLSSRNLVNVLATPYKELSLENILGAEAIFMSKKVFELVEKGLE